MTRVLRETIQRRLDELGGEHVSLDEFVARVRADLDVWPASGTFHESAWDQAWEAAKGRIDAAQMADLPELEQRAMWGDR